MTRGRGGTGRAPRLRVGVVGCGLAAQVIHIPALLRLRDQFDTVALCDRVPDLAREVSRRYQIGRYYSSVDALIDANLDAVFILTSGPHEHLVLQALEAGLHVFVEKPFCFDPAGGERALREARRRERIVMVGCHKRYDPAFDVARTLIGDAGDLALITTTTLEGPLAASLAAHEIIGHIGSAPTWPTSARREIEAAIPNASMSVRRAYEACMLESMVHDINLVRGLVDGPVEVLSASVRADGAGVSAQLRVGSMTEWVAAWHSFSRLDRYSQRFGFYSPGQWLRLDYPSPFHDDPTAVTVERNGASGETTSSETITASFQSAYLRQLKHFYRCVVTRATPRTGDAEGLRDVKVLCEIAQRASSSVEHEQETSR